MLLDPKGLLESHRRECVVVDEVLIGVPEHDVFLGSPVAKQCHVLVQSLYVVKDN